jgi:electron transfer flavoprotein alpha subunit
MAARVIVSAADLAGLRRVAEAARALAGDGRVEAVVVTGDGGVLAPAAAGLDEVAAAAGGLADVVLAYPAGPVLRGDLWAVALKEAAGDDVTAVFVADAPPAREAAGRLAVMLEAACASMCDAVTAAADGGLTAQRAIYGGIANGTLKLSRSPAVCLFAAGVSEAPMGAPAPVEQRPAPTAPFDLELVGDQPVEKTVDLVGARRIVSVGRGFAKAEDISLVDPLVAALGAELGCSRPIAEDFKWLPKERLVGLTGSSVTPDLYVALGISGQVQHLTGIKGAKVVVAVNNDPRAPIARNADYVIQADLYKVLPALIAALGG